jgi:phosphotransferase system  glucose/maltose/N-acetylglucosamine-specific IIC component
MAAAVFTHSEARPMSDALLDYSSWSFQLITVLAILYLVFGLARPSWVLASKRSTVVIVAAVVMLIAATLFYLVIRPLPGALVAPDTIGTEPPVPQSTPAQP